MTDWVPDFDQRVRVRPNLCGVPKRMFMYCERRPTVCESHGYAHGGHLFVEAHHPEEVGQEGEIISHLGGENAGHPWIVRFDRNLPILWSDGQTIHVNAGTYTADELELLSEAPA